MEDELRTSDEWKNYGNKQFVLKKYSDAIKAYSIGLSLCNYEDKDLLANRAAAFLNLECFSRALKDADSVLKSDPNHTKAIFRKARALLGLSKCQEAVDFLQNEISKQKRFSSSKEIQELMEKAQMMLKQQKTGEYDVNEYFYEHYTKIDNWAEYYGPISITNIPGKGRGVVANENIQEGELIMACRAFAIEFHEPGKMEPDPEEDNIMNDPSVSSLHDKGGQWLVQRIYDKLKESPELGSELYQLFAGPNLGSLDPEKDDCTQVSPERISGIVRYNCYANSDDTSDAEKSSGLFIFASYLNHQCVDNNVTWKMYGNFNMIRAYRPIQKGDELLISYASPTWAFKTRESLLNDRLGFRCDCRLCTLDRELAPQVIVVREKLQQLALKQEIQFIGLPNSDPAEIYKKFQESSTLLQEIIRRLDDMHPKHGDLTVLCLDPLQKLGMKYFGVGEFEKAASCMERAHSIMKAASLPHGAVETMLWVVGSYLQLENTKMAKYWIQILKKDAQLAHGTLSVLKTMGAWVIQAMEDHHVSF